MEKRFKVLRILATLLKVIAWILLVVGILGAVAAVAGGALGGGVLGDTLESLSGGVVVGLLGGIAAGAGLLLGAVLQFVMLYAAGEAISVTLAIEENTREAAYYLRGEPPMPSSPYAP